MQVQFFVILAGCGYCKAFYPLFLSVSSNNKLPLTFAKVNVEKDKLLGEKAGIHGLPSIALYKYGDMMDHYKGDRTYISFKRFIDKRYGKGYDFIESEEELNKNIEEVKSTIMWGGSSDIKGFELFEKFAKEFPETFVVYPESKYQKVQTPLVLVKEKNSNLIYSGSPNEDEMRIFITKNKDPLSYELSEKTADLLLPENDDSPSFVFARNPESISSSAMIEIELLKAAEILQGKIKFFTFTPTEDNKNILNFFGISNKTLPAVIFNSYP